MKIALCISGMLRTFEKCIPTIIEHVKADKDVDVFIATWDVHGTNPVWWEVSKDNTPVDFGILSRYKKDLNIKKILIDSYEDSDFMKQVEVNLAHGGKYHGYKGHCNPRNFLPMIKKIEQAHMLMIDNNVHYDIVVKMRADLFFKSKVEFIKPEPNTIYMPETGCWGPGSLNDQFLYGNGLTMSVHASLYRQLDRLFSKDPILHPETVLHNYYQELGFKVIKHPIQFHIER